MRVLRPHSCDADPRQRGAALLLSLLILLVLVAIVIQINVSTSTDARVARNDVGLTAMDLAIESALLQEYDQLATDGDSGSGGAAPASGGQPAAGPPAPAPAAGGAAAAPGSQPSDSRRDDWAQVQRTEINEIKLRIFVQDEDSKINVLNLLNIDEKLAEAAFERVVRCLDMCRAGTRADIPERTAEDMTRGMLEFMRQRGQAKLPRPTLLTDDEQSPDVGLPLSLRDFAVLPNFDDSLFRDYRDEDGQMVHSIGSFLTVWTSLTTKGEEESSAGGGPGGGASTATPGGGGNPGTPDPNPAPGTPGGGGQTPGGAAPAVPSTTVGPGGAPAAQSNPGWAVNVNTAPVAVLKALFDDRDVRPQLWDKVVEYRNLEEEEEGDAEEDEAPTLDEFGEEVIERKIFDSLAELSEVDGFNDLETELQGKVKEMLTTQSEVFSIFVVARRTTSAEGDVPFTGRESRELAEEQGDALVRVVRAVVWRHEVEDKVEIIPIVRWEWLDYVPYEVQDYPDDDR